MNSLELICVCLNFIFNAVFIRVIYVRDDCSVIVNCGKFVSC